MTMLDDDQLATLFTRAAADFELPASGPAEIVLRARAGRGRRAGEDGQRRPTHTGRDTRTVATRVRRPGGGRVACAGPARRRRATASWRWPPASSSLLAAAAIAGAISRSTSSPTATSSLRPVRARSPAPGGVLPGDDDRAARVQHEPCRSARPGARPRHPSRRPGPTRRHPRPAPRSPASAGALPTGAVGQPARIEQTGTLGLTVKPGALNRTMTQLSAIATGAGGFVASSQTQTGSGARRPPSGTITLQVPVADFASVLKQAAGPGQDVEPHHEGHRRHRAVRRPPGAHRRARGDPSAVPDHHGQGDLASATSSRCRRSWTRCSRRSSSSRASCSC